MRRLFIVLAKLVGLLQLYWIPMGLLQTWISYSIYSRSESLQSEHVLVNLIMVSVYLVLSLGSAWLLLAQTDWVADKLGVQGETDIAGLETQSVLLVGVQLIGVYVTVYAAPHLVSVLLADWDHWNWHMEWRSWSRLLSAAFELGLGIFLMLGAGKVVEIITKKKQPAELDD